MQLVFLLRVLVSHPLTRFVSQLLLMPNNCPVLKILGFYPQPSFQGQPITSPQLEVVREGIPPTESRDGPPPLPPKTGPLARFRWQKQLFKDSLMFLSIIRIRGWIVKLVGFVLSKVLSTCVLSSLTNYRE